MQPQGEREKGQAEPTEVKSWMDDADPSEDEQQEGEDQEDQTQWRCHYITPVS